MRDRNFFVGGQRHAFFVDGQRDYAGAVALGHRQHFRGALLAVFEVDRVDDGLAGDALQRLFDYVGFGAVDQYRRGHSGGDFFEDGGDVALLVFAHDGAAQVEHVRAFVGQLFRQRQNVVVLFGLHQLAEMIDPRRGVHLLRYDQGLGLQIERDGGVGARRRAYRLHVALGGLDAGHCIDHGFQMFGSRAATSAYDSYAVVFYEMLVKVGQIFRRELVDRVSAYVLRQSGVRQNRNELGGVQAQIADRLVHLRRTGGAVQTNDVDVVGLERRQRRADFGAQQHGSGFLQRDLHLHGQALARFAHCLEHGYGRDLCLQQVLAGFDQQHVDSAFDQRRRLLFVGRQHRVPTDVA